MTWSINIDIYILVTLCLIKLIKQSFILSEKAVRLIKGLTVLVHNFWFSKTCYALRCFWFSNTCYALKFGTVLLTCCKTVYFDSYVLFIDILVNLVGKALAYD